MKERAWKRRLNSKIVSAQTCICSSLPAPRPPSPRTSPAPPLAHRSARAHPIFGPLFSDFRWHFPLSVIIIRVPNFIIEVQLFQFKIWKMNRLDIYSIFVFCFNLWFLFLFSLFFVSGPCARLSWPSRQLLSARKSTVSYRIVSYKQV